MCQKTFNYVRISLFVFLILLTLWNFSGMISYTAEMFNSPLEDMKHGWLVPLFPLFLVWKKRGLFREAVGKPSWRGVVWVLFFLFLAWFGNRGEQSRLEQLSFIGLVWALPYAFWGREIAKLMAFPALFLCFTIPVSSYVDFFTIHLRIFSSSVATGLLNGLGIPVERVGTALFSQAPGAEFKVDVADPCSGIRSLFAMMALSTAYAYLTQKTLFRKFFLFFCALPIAVIGNMFRIMSICLVATWFGQDIATGFFHDYSGYVIFLAGIGLLILTGKLLERYGGKIEAHLPSLWGRGSSAGPSSRDRSPYRAGRAAVPVIAVSALVSTVFILNQRMPPPSFDPSSFISRNLPDRIGQFKGDTPLFCHNDQCLASYEVSRLKPEAKQPDGSYLCPRCGTKLAKISLGEYTDLPRDTEILKRYYHAPDGLSYSISVVIAGKQRGSIHRAELCLPAQGFIMQDAERFRLNILKDGRSVTCRRIRAAHSRNPGKMINLIYWFENADHRCSSHFIRILSDVWTRSLYNRINRWVMVSVNVSSDLRNEDEVRRLEEFLRDFYADVVLKEEKQI